MDLCLVRYCLPSNACHSLPYSLDTTWHIIWYSTLCWLPSKPALWRSDANRRIEACTTDIKRWMKSHQLLPNETKTETIVLYARNARVPPAITKVDVCRCHVTPQPAVWDFGIFLDSGMDMSMQVARTCQAAYFQLHSIAKKRHCLTVDAWKTIVHGLVISKLDYANALLYGINGRLLEKLHSAKFGGACNYAAAAPNHASVGSATQAAMARNIQYAGFYLLSDASSAQKHRWHDYGIYAGSPAWLCPKPSRGSTTPQFRTQWSAWLFTDGSAPVKRSTG